MMDYYQTKLAGNALKACYDIAPARIKQYLQAEIAVVLEKCAPQSSVLELGCGYGRVLQTIAPHAKHTFGIDSSTASLHAAQLFLTDSPIIHLAAMNAAQLGFRDRVFDLTVCIQNGISAFAIDQQHLFREAVRVTKPGGVVLFSTYSPQIWHARLEWFQIQSERGLIGPIDESASTNGVIVCRDGFKATTASPVLFRALAAHVKLLPKIYEIDESCLFCELSAATGGDPNPR